MIESILREELGPPWYGDPWKTSLRTWLLSWDLSDQMKPVYYYILGHEIEWELGFKLRLLTPEPVFVFTRLLYSLGPIISFQHLFVVVLQRECRYWVGFWIKWSSWFLPALRFCEHLNFYIHPNSNRNSNDSNT